MATEAQLQTLITTMQGELTTLGTDADAIIAKLNAGQPVSDADLAALQAIADGIKGASGKLEAATNPPPPPTPAP